MGGVWSIWLVSTVMGLKYFTLPGFVASFLILISIQPLLKNDITLRSSIPVLALAVLLTYGVVINLTMLMYLLPYATLLVLQRYLKKRLGQRAYIQAGSLILTSPFPLMAGFYAIHPSEVLIPWLLLITLTYFNVILAESVIFEKGMKVRNYAAFLVLSILLIVYTPLLMSLSILLLAATLMVISRKLSLKKLGFSLLGLHMLFAVEYLLLF